MVGSAFVPRRAPCMWFKMGSRASGQDKKGSMWWFRASGQDKKKEREELAFPAF